MATSLRETPGGDLRQSAPNEILRRNLPEKSREEISDTLYSGDPPKKSTLEICWGHLLGKSPGENLSRNVATETAQGNLLGKYPKETNPANLRLIPDTEISWITTHRTPCRHLNVASGWSWRCRGSFPIWFWQPCRYLQWGLRVRCL